jgi:hypothetical protein
MIRFVTNQKGGSNLQDTDGYLYKVTFYEKCTVVQSERYIPLVLNRIVNISTF